MRHRNLLLALGLCCLNVAAWGQSGAAQKAPDLSLPKSPAAASTAANGYRDPLSNAASSSQRFNFNDSTKDPAPPDQSPIRVIINNGHGPNVNCVPMGPGGGCH